MTIAGSIQPTPATKAMRVAAGLFLHYIIYEEPGGRFVLRACTIGSTYSRVVAYGESIEECRRSIPPGYENTGVPDGPTMREVWV